MLEIALTPEGITTVAGIGLSLLFSYVPGFATWYNRLGENPDGTNDNGTLKRLVMLGLLLLTAISAVSLTCAGLLNGVACDRSGVVMAAQSFIFALIANQAVHVASPRVGLKAAKAKNLEPTYIFSGKTQFPGEDR